MATKYPDWAAYLKTWADELRAKQDRVRALIGHAHWGEEGGYKESILRKVLCEMLPDQYGVSTGFLHFFDDGVSPQQDIIIWDRAESAALVEDGEFAIVPFQAVAAIIEVKSTLTARTLTDALRTLHPYQLNFWANKSIPNRTVRLVREPQSPPVRMVFAFQTAMSVDSLFRTVTRFYRETFGQDAYMMLNSGNPVFGTGNIVDDVVVLDRLAVEASSLPCLGANKVSNRWPVLAAYSRKDGAIPAFEYALVQLRMKLEAIRHSHNPAVWAMYKTTKLGPCRCDVLQLFAGDADLGNPLLNSDDVHLWRANPPLVDPIAECPWDDDGNLIAKDGV